MIPRQSTVVRIQPLRSSSCIVLIISMIAYSCVVLGSELCGASTAKSDKHIVTHTERWQFEYIGCVSPPVAENGVSIDAVHAHIQVQLLVNNNSPLARPISFRQIRFLDDNGSLHEPEITQLPSERLLPPKSSVQMLLHFRTPLIMHHSKIVLPTFDGNTAERLPVPSTDCQATDIMENRF